MGFEVASRRRSAGRSGPKSSAGAHWPGCAEATAWTTKQKIMAVMARREGNKPLSGRVEMDDAWPGGARSGGKRGRGAPGKTPFVAAVKRFCHRVNHVCAANFDSR